MRRGISSFFLTQYKSLLKTNFNLHLVNRMQKQVLLNSIKGIFNPKFIDYLIYILIGFWFFIRLTDFASFTFSIRQVYILQIKFTRGLTILFVLIYFYKWLTFSKDKFNFLLCVIFLLTSYFLNKFAKTQLVFDLFFIPLFLCQFLYKEKFYKYVLVSFCLLFILVIIMHYLGYSQDIAYFSRSEGIRRYTLGFAHPNGLGFIIALFSIFYVILKTKFKFYDYFLLFVFSSFCYFVPNSVTSSCIIILLAVSVFLSHYISRRKFDRKSTYVILFLCLFIVGTVLFFTYYITFTENFKEYVQILPGSMWARFELSKKGYDILGFSLLGKYDEYCAMTLSIAQKYGFQAVWLILDCSYFYLPIVHGFFVFGIYLAMIIYSLIRGVMRQDFLYAFILVVIVVYGVSETTIFRPVMMPLFAYPFFFYSKKKLALKSK